MDEDLDPKGALQEILEGLPKSEDDWTPNLALGRRREVIKAWGVTVRLGRPPGLGHMSWCQNSL